MRKSEYAAGIAFIIFIMLMFYFLIIPGDGKVVSRENGLYVLISFIIAIISVAYIINNQPTTPGDF